MRTAFLFPGQGSQFVGMGRDLAESIPAARAVFARANEVLGFDLTRICHQGPEDELRETRNTQPAIFVHSAAVLAALDLRPAGAGVCLAGHSLGEYSAYYAAGSLTFEDALRLVRRRGELMWEAGRARPGTMAAVLGMEGEQVRAALREVGGTVVAANLNSPSQVVISGEVEAVGSAMEALRQAGAKRVVRLDVSGAFHSPLMEAAAEGLAAALSGVAVEPAAAPVYANASARPVTDPDEIRASLVRQLLSPVRWEETIRNMKADGFSRFVELGPGKVLGGLVRAIERDAEAVAVGTTEQVDAFRAIDAGGVV